MPKRSAGAGRAGVVGRGGQMVKWSNGQMVKARHAGGGVGGFVRGLRGGIGAATLRDASKVKPDASSELLEASKEELGAAWMELDASKKEPDASLMLLDASKEKRQASLGELKAALVELDASTMLHLRAPELHPGDQKRPRVDVKLHRVDEKPLRVDQKPLRVDAKLSRVDVKPFRVDEMLLRVDEKLLRVDAKLFRVARRPLSRCPDRPIIAPPPPERANPHTNPERALPRWPSFGHLTI